MCVTFMVDLHNYIYVYSNRINTHTTYALLVGARIHKWLKAVREVMRKAIGKYLPPSCSVALHWY